MSRIFLLKWIFSYRILCLAVTLALMFFARTEKGILFRHPFWFFVHFSAGTVVYIFIMHKFRLCLGFLILDYFAVLLYQYFAPHLVLMEIFWIPGILMAVAVTCWMSKTSIFMCVVNNGEGISQPIKRGIGIASMEDFITKHDGTIVIQSGSREFKITAAIPWEALRGEPAGGV